MLRDLITTKHMIIVFLLLLPFVGSAFAVEQILITISSEMKDVIFDGIWTHKLEWKRSSLDTLTFDNNKVIQLRTAHQENFIYIFIDAVFDTNLDKGTDRAIVCIDSKNDKTLIANEDDYCFGVTLGAHHGFMYQGGSPVALNGNFKKISNHPDFIAMADISNENDRHSKIPHASYEFKIPTELVDRSNIYGFYLAVYDDHSKTVYPWPQNAITDRHFTIASPSQWGELVSPDKSLPEFDVPILLASLAFLPIILLSRLKMGSHHQ